MEIFKTGGYCPNCLSSTENCTCWENISKINIMSDKLNDVNLIEELFDTFAEVRHQLIEDQKRYGDTWKERGLVWKKMNQETRWFYKMQEYYEDFVNEAVPIPWDKVIGEAHIAKVREKKLN